MNNQSLPESLRRLADWVERNLEPLGETRIGVHVHVHHANTIEAVRTLSELDDLQSHQNKGTHWVKAWLTAAIEVNAFYPPGLLGKKKQRKVRVVESESTDLSILKVQP